MMRNARCLWLREPCPGTNQHNDNISLPSAVNSLGGDWDSWSVNTDHQQSHDAVMGMKAMISSGLTIVHLTLSGSAR